MVEIFQGHLINELVFHILWEYDLLELDHSIHG